MICLLCATKRFWLLGAHAVVITLFEFHNESEPVKMAEKVGLRVTQLVSNAGLPASGGRFLPRALGMVLWRR